MDRRHFLGWMAAGLLAGRSGADYAAGTLLSSAPPSLNIPLWKGIPPGGGGPQGPVKWSSSGALSHVSHPWLTLYSPAQPNGHAVLIAAGGGYKRIENAHEAIPAALWLSERGFSAYILNYRLPGEGWKDTHLVSLQDAQRALRILRQREKFVSVLGFSAGGHLLGMAATRPQFASYPATDAIDSKPATADRAALIYPVITLEPPYTHTSTHRILVGPHASLTEDARWSVQNFVTPEAPPFFLVQACDDPVSDPHNTLIMQAACQHNHVPVSLYRYSVGGHGFGMGRPGTPTMQWPSHYQHWLKQWQASAV